MRRALAVGVCAAALGLGGCGGGSNTASTASGTAQDTAGPLQPSQRSTAAQEEGKSKQAEGSAAKSEGSEEQSSGSEKKAPNPVSVPPVSSAPIAGSKAPAPGVKTVKGGDNSVQEYGVEADESARTEAAIALQAYLNERLQEDWASACSALAQRPKEQLEKLARSASQQGTGLDGCPATMAFLSKGTPQSQLQEEATITEVLSFRGEGDVSGGPSYLIFTGPPAKTLYSMPMYLEGSAWKVGLAQRAELPVR